MSWEFSELDRAIKSWFRSPVIRTKIIPSSLGPQLSIIADYNLESKEKNHKDLDDYISWTEEKLKNWSGVKRHSYNVWIFENQREIEKFKTLFALFQSDEHSKSIK